MACRRDRRSSLDEPVGIALIADEYELWWEPRCAGVVRAYRIDGTAVCSCPPRAMPCFRRLARRHRQSARSRSRRDSRRLARALDAATTVGRTPANGVAARRRRPLGSLVQPVMPANAPRMTVTTRFAPSPTGRLHVGNVRTALHNWLLAQEARRALPAADRRYRRGAQRGAVRRGDPRGPRLARAGARRRGAAVGAAGALRGGVRAAQGGGAGLSVPTRPRRSSISSARSRSAAGCRRSTTARRSR